MESLSLLHKTNLLFHIAAGLAAILTGFIPITATKGGKLHRKTGKVFLVLLMVVILTGLAGVFIYGRNTFLLVITVLTGYLGFSGYRTLQTKSNQPKLPDIIAALLALLSVSYFLYYFKSIGMIWAPGIIYSTVGYLILIITYDFSRYLIKADKYSNLWRYEHILKMVSALSGLCSAFSGTMLPQYRPYSQFLPSVIGALIALGFIINVYRKQQKKIQPVKPVQSHASRD